MFFSLVQKIERSSLKLLCIMRRHVFTNYCIRITWVIKTCQIEKKRLNVLGRHGPTFEIYIFGILTSNPTTWLKQNFWSFLDLDLSSGPMCGQHL